MNYLYFLSATFPTPTLLTMIFVLSILPFLTTSTSTTTFTTSPIIYATTTSILIFISMVVDVMKVALMIMTLLYCYDPMTLYQNALRPSN